MTRDERIKEIEEHLERPFGLVAKLDIVVDCRYLLSECERLEQEVKTLKDRLRLTTRFTGRKGSDTSADSDLIPSPRED